MRFFGKRKAEAVNEKEHSLRRRAVTAVLAVLAFLSMTTTTYAWFKLNIFAGVGDLEIKISTGAELRVAMENLGTDISAYGKSITEEMLNDYLSDYNMTSDKIFLEPVTTSDGISFTDADGEKKLPNSVSYLQFKCFFISSEDMWVHLTDGEGLIGADNVKTSVTTESTGAKADVIYCSRIGFLSNSGSAIFEPYSGTPVNEQKTFDLPQGQSNYSDGTRLFYLKAFEPTEVTVTVWIDGEDPQCDDDVQGAHLAIDLGFIGCDSDNVPIY